MPAGAADAIHLCEVGLRAGAESIYEGLERVRVGSVLCLELAQLALRASHDEFGERRGVRPQTRAQRL